MKTAMMVTLKNFIRAVIISTALSNFAFAQQPDLSPPENEAKTHYMMGILGYNYTNEPINQFSIDGQGGGDIHVSSPTSGGGGTVCCVMFSKKPKWPIQVVVRWQSGGCRVYDKDRRYGHNQYYFKEKLVNVERGKSAHPSDIAVHFYNDGTVRVILADGVEEPLLILPEGRANKKNFPECKPGDPLEYL